MTETELFENVDAYESSTISCVEFSEFVYHSPKHGPNSFRMADRDRDGVLNSDEFVEALSKVSWWKLSRKTRDEWFIQADRNSDRKLDMKKFAIICISGNYIENVFKRTDRDRSGQFGLRETAAYIRGVTHGVDRKKSKPERDE
jgi:hypothetical protein